MTSFLRNCFFLFAAYLLAPIYVALASVEGQFEIQFIDIDIDEHVFRGHVVVDSKTNKCIARFPSYPGYPCDDEVLARQFARQLNKFGFALREVLREDGKKFFRDFQVYDRTGNPIKVFKSAVTADWENNYFSDNDANSFFLEELSKGNFRIKGKYWFLSRTPYTYQVVGTNDRSFAQFTTQEEAEACIKQLSHHIE